MNETFRFSEFSCTHIISSQSDYFKHILGTHLKKTTDYYIFNFYQVLLQNQRIWITNQNPDLKIKIKIKAHQTYTAFCIPAKSCISFPSILQDGSSISDSSGSRANQSLGLFIYLLIWRSESRTTTNDRAKLLKRSISAESKGFIITWWAKRKSNMNAKCFETCPLRYKLH